MRATPPFVGRWDDAGFGVAGQPARMCTKRQVEGGFVRLVGGSFFGIVLVAMTLGVAHGSDLSYGVKEWSLIGSSGAVRTVYVSPQGLQDKIYVAKVLKEVVTRYGTSGPIQVMIFNDRRFTPSHLPMTKAQMLHQKAQYTKNPYTAIEEFVWISVENSQTSPPAMKHTRANIRPGRAE